MKGIRLCVLWLFSVRAIAAGFAAQEMPAPTAELACGNSAVLHLPAAQNEIVVTALARGWLRLDEQGVQIAVAPLEEPEFRLAQPLRSGSVWLTVTAGRRISVRRLEPNLAAATFRAILHCDADAPFANQITWLKALAKLDTDVVNAADRVAAQSAASQLDALSRSAPDEKTRALAKHLHALALDNANDHAAAANEFSAVEQLWAGEGEAGSASAARVGRIDAEFSAGHLQTVLDDTAGEIVASSAYFRARLKNQRCLAFEGLGRYDEASGCYRETLADLLALDERGEYASTLRNLAGLRRKQGFFDEAVALANQGLATAIGPYAPMTRGRLHLLLGVIAQQRGEIGTSIREVELANTDLARAGTGALFWRTTALLNQAIVFEQVGAYEEAYASLAAVSALAGPEESLALRAKVFADLEFDTRHFDSAQLWSSMAETLFIRSGLLPAADAARLTRWQRLLESGDSFGLERALQEQAVSAPLYRPQWRLLEAQYAVAKNATADAESLLRDVTPAFLPLRDQFRYVVLRARIAAQSGDANAAATQLWQASLRWDAALRRVGSPLLRQMLERQRIVLEREAYDLVLLHDTSTPSTVAEALWPWIAWLPPHAVAERHVGDSAQRFDAAVAAELLPLGKGNGDTSTRAALWSLMAEEPVHTVLDTATPSAPSFAAFQKSLDSDTVAVAYLEGASRAAVLWITRDSIALRTSPSPTAFRAHVTALRESARHPDTPLAEIDAAAARVAADLFAAAPIGHAPARLLVVRGSALDGALLDVLRWPGSTERLIDTTRISRVRFGAVTEARGVTPDMPTLLVETAPQVSADRGLPGLPQARSEGALIRAAMPDGAVRLIEETPRTRTALLAVLASPGAWVHVAAHGAARPGRVGFGGIWLEPDAADARPTLLSTADVLDSDIRADLVVLASCRLGDYGESVDANLRFADAVSRAGARQVVAALWPVSDSAAGLWVPAFYAALVADASHDASRALRAAQDRLRHARAFAHPFFWAGLEATTTWRESPSTP